LNSIIPRDDRNHKPSVLGRHRKDLQLFVRKELSAPRRVERKSLAKAGPSELSGKRFTGLDGRDDFLLGCTSLSQSLECMSVEMDNHQSPKKAWWGPGLTLRQDSGGLLPELPGRVKLFIEPSHVHCQDTLAMVVYLKTL
jgi:hypothetical protein